MKALKTAYETLKSKRFWKWEVGSAAIYGIPVAIRFITKNPVIPILNAPDPYTCNVNILEKLMVNAFFPGGSGGVAGEIFAGNYSGHELKGRKKYLARLGGSMLQTTLWTALVQYPLTGVMGPHGAKLGEGPELYLLNYLLAAGSVVTPDVLNYIESKTQIAGKAKKFAKKAVSKIHLPSQS